MILGNDKSIFKADHQFISFYWNDAPVHFADIKSGEQSHDSQVCYNQ